MEHKPKDPTNAERQARFRKKQGEAGLVTFREYVTQTELTALSEFLERLRKRR